MSTNFKKLVAGVPETIKLPVAILFRAGWFLPRNTKLKILVTLVVLNLGYIIVVGSIQLAYAKTLSEFVQNLEGIFSAVHVLGKLIVVFFQNINLMKLIRMTDKFWTANNPKDKENYDNTRQFILHIERIFFVLFAVAITSLVFLTYYYNIVTLGVWTLEGYHILFRLLQITQTIHCSACGLFIWTVDVLYLAFCLETVIQFKIISSHLKQLEEFDINSPETEYLCLEKLKSCINHYQYMKGFLKNMQNVFSLVMFLEYITDVPVFLADLFAAQEGVSFALQVRYIMVVLSLTMQLAIFCIPTTYISYEVSEISKAAYFSNWETKLFPSMKVPLIMLMQNSQQMIVIKAGGIIAFNTDTVLNVLKVAWTATSILKGLK